MILLKVNKNCKSEMQNDQKKYCQLYYRGKKFFEGYLYQSKINEWLRKGVDVNLIDPPAESN